jgi:hypothetical protein
MLEKAIRKIEAEMTKGKNNGFVQIIGKFLLAYLEENPEEAEKIVKSKNTLIGIVSIVCTAASKKKVGVNYAVLTDEEVYGIVLKSFDIKQVKELNLNVQAKEEIIKENVSIEFDVSLDDYLD